MRQQTKRSLDGWALAAILGPLVALLVVVGDLELIFNRADFLQRAALLGSFPWVAALLPVVVVLGVLLGYRASAMVSAAVVFASVAVERLQAAVLPNGAMNLRLDEVLIPSIAVGLVALSLHRRQFFFDLKRIPGLLPLGLFLASNLVPTLLVMQNRTRGLSLFIILLAGGLSYLAVVLLAEKAPVRSLMIPLLVVGGLEAAFGLGAWGLSVLNPNQPVFGVQFNADTAQLEPYGTMYEANFFGQYLAAVTLIALAILLGLIAQRRLRLGMASFLLLTIALMGAGVAVSMTRASWVGLAVGLLVLAFLWPVRAAAAWRRKRVVAARRALVVRWIATSAAVGAMGLAAIGALFLIGGSDSSLWERFTTIFNFTTGSGYGRLRILNQVIQDWRNPILGMGDGSFNLTLPPLPGHAPDAPWIYSMFLAILHDSGLVGFVLFGWLLFVVYRGLVRTIQRSPEPMVQALAVGLAAALTSILVASQATTSMYLMLFWVLFGLAGAMPLLTYLRWTPDENDVALVPTRVMPAYKRVGRRGGKPAASDEPTLAELPTQILERVSERVPEHPLGQPPHVEDDVAEQATVHMRRTNAPASDDSDVTQQATVAMPQTHLPTPDQPPR